MLSLNVSEGLRRKWAKSFTQILTLESTINAPRAVYDGTGAQAFPVESQAIDFHDRPCLQPQFVVESELRTSENI